jgi:hypothetical protein
MEILWVTAPKSRMDPLSLFSENTRYLACPWVNGKDILNHATVFSILSQHARDDYILMFAEETQNWDRVIQIYLARSEWGRALGVIARQPTAKLLYRYSPNLVKVAAKETIQLWMRFSSLNPRLLLPAMLKYEMSRIGLSSTQNFVAGYLEYCIDTLQSRDTILQNYLLHIYVEEIEFPGNRQRITRLLKSQVNTKNF